MQFKKTCSRVGATEEDARDRAADDLLWQSENNLHANLKTNAQQLSCWQRLCLFKSKGKLARPRSFVIMWSLVIAALQPCPSLQPSRGHNLVSPLAVNHSVEKAATCTTSLSFF